MLSLRCVADIGKLGWYFVDCKDPLFLYRRRPPCGPFALLLAYCVREHSLTAENQCFSKNMFGPNSGPFSFPYQPNSHLHRARNIGGSFLQQHMYPLHDAGRQCVFQGNFFTPYLFQLPRRHGKLWVRKCRTWHRFHWRMRNLNAS